MINMVKEIISEPGRTFSEYSLLTGYTTRNCRIQDISLESNMAGLGLKLPFFSAAMMSVTGYDMALALGKEGGLGVLPSRLSVDEQVDIIKRIKNYEMSFVEEPEKVHESKSVGDAKDIVERYGHSKVPVVDTNNVFKGMFTRQRYLEISPGLQERVVDSMIRFESGALPCYNEPGIDVDRAKELLALNKHNYLVVLDDLNRLVKLAFKKDVEELKLGAAISTYNGWQERVEATVSAGIDLIVIDTSDAYSGFVEDVLDEYKLMNIDVPICAGNIITYDGALFLMEHGADIVKVGMSSGSICTTQRQTAVGRAPMTALMEADRARNTFRRDGCCGKDVPLIMDGGITTSADMVIALTIADGIMMGGYFNRFYEASGEKLDKYGKGTTVESEMNKVMSWGEGSERARNLGRYGQTQTTFFTEGIERPVPYEGRLKPFLKEDISKIKAALSKAGCRNLEELRKKSIIELFSPHSQSIVGNVHNVLGGADGS